MPVRLKKLIGVFVLLLGLCLYVWGAVTLAGRFLPQNGLLQLLYYAAAGIAWAFPARLLISWMSRERPARP